MNRRSRHLVVLMVAVVTAAIASFAVYRAMLQRPADAAERAPQSVVVAARSMAIGTELTEHDVKLVAWPAGNAVPGAINDMKNAVEPWAPDRGPRERAHHGQQARLDGRVGTAAGHPARHARDVGQGQRRHRRRRIRRAGHPRRRGRDDSPPDRQHDAHRGQQRPGAGRRHAPGSGQAREPTPRRANASTVVTLLVSPKDAERIALAQAEGEIMLMLRNPLDTEPTATTGVKTGVAARRRARRLRRSSGRRRRVGRPPPAPAQPQVEDPQPAEAENDRSHPRHEAHGRRDQGRIEQGRSEQGRRD